MAYFYPELICEIDAKGGRAVVEINPHVDYIAQFAYGTMHDLSEEYEYAAEVYENIKCLFVTRYSRLTSIKMI